MLQYFATYSCERLLRLEQRLRGNEDAECFQMLVEDEAAAGVPDQASTHSMPSLSHRK